MKVTQTEEILRQIDQHARIKKISNEEIGRRSGYKEKVVSKLLSDPPTDASIQLCVLLADAVGCRLTFQVAVKS